MARSHLRFPHLHGGTLVFTAEDDVWSAPLAGGRAHRLTADEALVLRPAATPRDPSTRSARTRPAPPRVDRSGTPS